jgi:hypothetical protein
VSEDFTIRAGGQWTPVQVSGVVAAWALDQPEIDPSEAADVEFVFDTDGVTGQFLVVAEEGVVEFGIYSGEDDALDRDRDLLLERAEGLARALKGRLRPNDGED